MSSTWSSSERLIHRRAILSGSPSTPEELSIAYTECRSDGQEKGTILLIHGFPETAYQFRHVIQPLADAGYRIIAPDYRGAGHSSKPRHGYEKIRMAEDLYRLVSEHLHITSKIHVVGHDIGGMVAHAYAARYSAKTASVCWGECPLPGTQVYDRVVKEQAYGGLWHFVFHWQIDLPELLTQGKEREYIKHFYDRLNINPAAIGKEDVDYYASLFAQPGAMRAGFDVYRAFHQDVKDNREWLKVHGKCKVPCMSLSGRDSFLASIAEEQSNEMYESVEVGLVPGSGHWCAEENPKDFVKIVLDWISKCK